MATSSHIRALVAVPVPRLTSGITRRSPIREPKKTIDDLIKEASAKLGENIQVRRFVRFQMGEE